MGGRPYQINKRNLFIYTAANLQQIRQRSADLEGIMIEVDLDYVIPIVNKVANSENLLYLRENPCLSLSEEQYTFVENLLKSVEKRINRESVCNSSRQKQHLISELIKSWGQVICYELLNIYFSNEPQTPLPQDKKDKIFQNFMITLYRYYRQERDVTFYADKQCLSARYFSSVIKEKSGSSAAFRNVSTAECCPRLMDFIVPTSSTIPVNTGTPPHFQSGNLRQAVPIGCSCKNGSGRNQNR